MPNVPTIVSPAGKTAENAVERAAPSWCSVYPWLPWVAPFVVYIALLGLAEHFPFGAVGNHTARLVLCGGFVAVCSRRLFSLRMVNPLGSIGVGIAVFLIWIAPDTLWPGYRTHWLFSNDVLGTYDPGANAHLASASGLFFALRLSVSVLLVPVIEELFWRGFVMRIAIRNDFDKIPLGTWHRNAFLITAALFALEHGMYWDVGLAAGIIYGAWMVKMKNLGDVIWAHAITNGLLAAWVITQGAWQYWP